MSTPSIVTSWVKVSSQHSVFSTVVLSFLYFLNLQAKEESESWDVEVPLGPEQPHVHLDLSIKVGSVGVLTVFLRGHSNKILTPCKKGFYL